jgi:hypothetical protein
MFHSFGLEIFICSLRYKTCHLHENNHIFFKISHTEAQQTVVNQKKNVSELII